MAGEALFDDEPKEAAQALGVPERCAPEHAFQLRASSLFRDRINGRRR
jgi:hypothetical protein